MREWRGQHSDLPILGDHFLRAQNITFRVDGQVSRRPGLEYLTGHGAIAMRSFAARGESFLVLVESDGTVRAVDL